MKRVLRLSSVVTALVLLAPPPAAAKDACVSLFSGTGTLVFHKVKPVKKAGKTTPLYGVYLQGGNKAAASGSATMGADGQVVFGVFVHSLSPSFGNCLTFSVVGAPDFSGTGQFDNDGDFVADGPVTWTPVDCKTVAIP